MDLSNICTNCFRLKQGKTVCPHCKKTGAPQPKEAYHLTPGTVLNGRYLIGRVLGSGGFGVIYMALDLKLGRVIALKEFFPTSLVCRTPGERNVSIYSGDKQAEYQKGLARFLEEARNMASFARNPHIVNIFDFFTENRTAYIVMEYLNGVSLDEYIKTNGGKLSVSETIAVIKPVLLGLKALHEKSIIHRDITPKNIFITADNKVKIIDFGTAKFYEENEQTRTNVVSDGYAPPEQYKTKSVEGAYTDIYAVGATMYRAITGVTPLPVLERVAENDKMPTPLKLIKDLPESLDKAIMKAMAIKAKLRFQTVDEMLAAIDDPNAKFDYPEKEEKKRVIKRNVTVISILSAVLIALVVVLLATQQKDGLFDAVKSDINKNETIAVYIPYSDKAEADALEETYEDLSESFYKYSKTQYGKEITLDIQLVKESEYAKILNGNNTEGSVCLFRSDVSDSVNIEKASLNLLIDELGEDICFLEQYRRDYGPEYYSIPLSFEVYVMYTCKLEKTNMSDVTDWNDYAEKNTDFGLISVSDEALEAVYSSLKNANISAADAQKVFGKAVKDKKIVDRKTALNSFINEATPFYIGSIKDLDIIKHSDIGLSFDRVKNIFSCDKWYGSFDCEWSISANASESEKSAALLFLNYCLSDEGQQILYIGNEIEDEMLSINKYTLAEQKDYKDDLNFLPENIEEIHIYSSDSEEKIFSEQLRKEPAKLSSIVKNSF